MYAPPHRASSFGSVRAASDTLYADTRVANVAPGHPRCVAPGAAEARSGCDSWERLQAASGPRIRSRYRVVPMPPGEVRDLGLGACCDQATVVRGRADQSSTKEAQAQVSRAVETRRPVRRGRHGNPDTLIALLTEWVPWLPGDIRRVSTRALRQTSQTDSAFAASRSSEARSMSSLVARARGRRFSSRSRDQS